MSTYPVTLGVEEEVFVLEEGSLTPSLQSLDYLRRLYWKNPKRHARHTASNFAKGKDRQECFMGSVEIASGAHEEVDRLLEDLVKRRSEFARAADGGLVVAVGSLFTLSSASNTASSHVHVGVPRVERQRVYANLAYFAPVLAVAAANSPWAGGRPFGLSYRMTVQPGLVGPLREDREYRFQDLIISKRLGTIEMRIFDPVPELWRLRELLLAVQAIAAWPGQAPFDRDEYNRERSSWTLQGATPYVRRLLAELQEIYPLPEALVEAPLSGYLGRLAEQGGVEAAYEEADRIWRQPTEVPVSLRPSSALRKVTGLAGYYAIRLPYIAYKGYKEWYGKS